MTSLKKDNWVRVRARMLVLFGLSLVLLASQVLDARAAVNLISFDATPQDDGSILVTWATATEINTSAFLLYRSDSASGHGEQWVDRQPAKGGPAEAAEYSYTDTDVTPGVRYYYYLEELDRSGVRQKFPPVNAGSGLAPEYTATATSTATLTATATSGLPTGATATVTASPTVTAPAGAQATMTATPTQVTSRDQPTATRAYTNTPRPDATVTPAGTPAVTPPVLATATSPLLAPAQVATPTGGPQPPEPAPPEPSATPLRSAPVAGITPSPTPQIEVTNAPTETALPSPQVTQPPRVFESVAKAGPATGTPQRPSAQPAGPLVDQDERNTRLILLLGGGAIGLAALLGAAAVLIWRSRSR